MKIEEWNKVKAVKLMRTIAEKYGDDIEMVADEIRLKKLIKKLKKQGYTSLAEMLEHVK